MASMVGRLPVEGSWARHQAVRDALEAQHFQAIRLLAQGRSFVAAAEVLAFVPR